MKNANSVARLRPTAQNTQAVVAANWNSAILLLKR
jgi:hypothetical protein